MEDKTFTDQFIANLPLHSKPSPIQCDLQQLYEKTSTIGSGNFPSVPNHYRESPYHLSNIAKERCGCKKKKI